jgi:hypothetical protein
MKYMSVLNKEGYLPHFRARKGKHLLIKHGSRYRFAIADYGLYLYLNIQGPNIK